MPAITERTFIKVNPRNLPNNSSSSSLTFMTYNILAQHLIHKQSHPKSPPKTTRASHRIPLIIKEITKTFQPDIAVLQEVDMFEEHYRTAFEDAGYECLYELGEKAHGLLIIFKSYKFAQKEYKTIDFDTCIPYTSTPTKNIGQILLLSFKTDPNKHILVTNHHLYWRPTAIFEKTRQFYIMLTEIMKYDDENTCILVGGDSNFSPDTALYKLLTRKNSDEFDIKDFEHIDFEVETAKKENDTKADILQDKDLQPGNEIKDISTKDLVNAILSFPPLHSIYSEYKQLVNPSSESIIGEPDFTTWDSFWKGTLDYIFILNKEKDNIRIEYIAGMPPIVDVLPALPNTNYGSDHLFLMAKLSI